MTDRQDRFVHLDVRSENDAALRLLFVIGNSSRTEGKTGGYVYKSFRIQGTSGSREGTVLAQLQSVSPHAQIFETLEYLNNRSKTDLVREIHPNGNFREEIYDTYTRGWTSMSGTHIDALLLKPRREILNAAAAAGKSILMRITVRAQALDFRAVFASHGVDISEPRPNGPFGAFMILSNRYLIAKKRETRDPVCTELNIQYMQHLLNIDWDEALARFVLDRDGRLIDDAWAYLQRPVPGSREMRVRLIAAVEGCPRKSSGWPGRNSLLGRDASDLFRFDDRVEGFVIITPNTVQPFPSEKCSYDSLQRIFDNPNDPERQHFYDISLGGLPASTPKKSAKEYKQAQRHFKKLQTEYRRTGDHSLFWESEESYRYATELIADLSKISDADFERWCAENPKKQVILAGILYLGVIALYGAEKYDSNNRDAVYKSILGLAPERERQHLQQDLQTLYNDAAGNARQRDWKSLASKVEQMIKLIQEAGGSS